MTTSKSIAGLIGPTLVAGAVAVLLNLGTWPALIEQGFHDPALIFVSGFPLFVAGLAVVRVHNRWEGLSVLASFHSFGMRTTNRLSRPGMLAVSSAPQPARMPILRQWLRLRDENRARKIPLVLGTEAHWEDRQPVASG